MRYSEDRWLLVIYVACVVALVGLLIWGINDCNERRRCEDSGGRVEEYNCHTVMMPMSCGKGCTMLVPTTSCDWRCVK